jgi:zinc protease
VKAPTLDIERVELGNGLVLLLSENRNVPAVSLSAVIKTGERYVSDEQAGLASLAGTLLDAGTENRTAAEIAELIESVGGALETGASGATTGVSLRVLSDDINLAIDLAADLLRRSNFPDDRVRMEVAKRVAELRARQDEPRLVASDEFNEIVFAGTPLRRPTPGYEATVARVTPTELREYHRRFFTPDQTIISVAGDFDASETAEKLRAAFGDWNGGGQAPLPHVPAPQLQPSAVTRFVNQDKEQLNIFLGHLGIARTHPDYHALRVLDVILGDSPGFTSRIPRILRDEQGLTYTTYCHVARAAALDPGRFVAYIGTAPENLRRAVEGLREQINLIVAEPPAAEEVESAKAYLTGSYVFEFETNTQLTSFMAAAEIYGLGFDYPRRYLDEVSRVTPDEVFRVARAHLHPDKLTLVVVGPTEETVSL